jgi:hypothetical protein
MGMRFNDVSMFDLEYQRNVCESMLSPFFNPSKNLKRDIESHLANVNREIGRRMDRRDAMMRHPTNRFRNR